MRPQVVHRNSPLGLDAVYVGRPTKWGNRHTVGLCATCTVGAALRGGKPVRHTRAEAIALYERDLDANPKLLADLHELTGKDLCCWCWPDACHADVLLRRANT